MYVPCLAHLAFSETNKFCAFKGKTWLRLKISLFTCSVSWFSGNYIDILVSKLIKFYIRSVCFTLYNYTSISRKREKKISNIKECVARSRISEISETGILCWKATPSGSLCQVCVQYGRTWDPLRNLNSASLNSASVQSSRSPLRSEWDLNSSWCSQDPEFLLWYHGNHTSFLCRLHKWPLHCRHRQRYY